VWPEVKDDFIRHLTETIREFWRRSAQPGLRAVINRKNFDRLVACWQRQGRVGGQSDPDDLYIAPTVLVDVSPDSPIMQEEVFGPILPVLEIDSVEAAIEWVNRRPRPLGLYVFAEDPGVAERILDATESGDAAINDCTIHPLVPELPFSGVGNSGMGKNHGTGVSRRHQRAGASQRQDRSACATAVLAAHSGARLKTNDAAVMFRASDSRIDVECQGSHEGKQYLSSIRSRVSTGSCFQFRLSRIDQGPIDGFAFR
jgi:acyl-CoA reductase-like NAD-dependent aldehyde dehydrogenase